MVNMAKPNRPLRNPQNEMFAQMMAMAVLTAQSQKEVYVQVFGDDGLDDKAIDRKASQLACSKSVGDRIAYLGSRAMKTQEKRLEYTLENALNFLAKTVMAAPCEASMDNPLCEIKMSKDGPYPVFVDKLGALQLLSKLKGWLQEVNISVQVPSWSPSSEENITSAPDMEAELVDPRLADYPPDSPHLEDLGPHPAHGQSPEPGQSP